MFLPSPPTQLLARSVSFCVGCSKVRWDVKDITAELCRNKKSSADLHNRTRRQKEVCILVPVNASVWICVRPIVLFDKCFVPLKIQNHGYSAGGNSGKDIVSMAFLRI